MTRIDVIGASRLQLDELLRNKKRHELLDLIAELASLEPMFSPEQIAAARGMAPSTVLAKMKAGEIRAHLVSHNRYRASASAIRDWDNETALFLEKAA